MSVWLVSIVTLLYAGSSIDLWIQGKHGLSGMFLGYALANLGVIWALVYE